MNLRIKCTYRMTTTVKKIKIEFEEQNYYINGLSFLCDNNASYLLVNL